MFMFGFFFGMHFVDSASISANLLVDLYDYVMFYVFIIFFFVLYLFIVLVYRYSTFFVFSFNSVLSIFIFFVVFFFSKVFNVLYWDIFYFLFSRLPYLLLNYFADFFPLTFSRVDLFFDKVFYLFMSIKIYIIRILNCSFDSFFSLVEKLNVLFFYILNFVFVFGRIFNELFDKVDIWIGQHFFVGNYKVFFFYPFLIDYAKDFIVSKYLNFIKFFLEENWLIDYFSLKKFGMDFGFSLNLNRMFLVQVDRFLDHYLNRFKSVLFNYSFFFSLFRQFGLSFSLILEIIWTFIPTLILILIAIPSFWVLFCIDELLDPLVTVKCVGNQWYWSYEYNYYRIRFDSYMIPVDDLRLGDFRLLEVDNVLVLPVRVPQRIVVTSSDVIHSWAVPAFGIKVDGIPGRLNQVSFYGTRPGLFFGQCSELCGVNHGFMPIAVNMVPVSDFVMYVRLRGYDLLDLSFVGLRGGHGEIR